MVKNLFDERIESNALWEKADLLKALEDHMAAAEWPRPMLTPSEMQL